MIKIGESPPIESRGRWQPILVPACAWPREKYDNQNGHVGGLITAGSTKQLEAKDLAEVGRYLEANPGASAQDVAMCCSMSWKMAARLKKAWEGKA
jgi:hypothetical protein